MSAHTPGPWELDRSGSLVLAPNATDRWGITPVTVVDFAGAMGGDDVLADARLIAASPEMLAALRAILPFVLEDITDENGEVIEDRDDLNITGAYFDAIALVRAAIAKATSTSAVQP